MAAVGVATAVAEAIDACIRNRGRFEGIRPIWG